MSREETVKITSVGDGNCFSIFFVWRNCGSPVEKKKFSSTTGLRSTKNATTANSPAVSASIHQCAPNKPSLLTMRQAYPICPVSQSSPTSDLRLLTSDFLLLTSV